MPMFEARVRTTTGGSETTARVHARDAAEAKRLLEQQYGPRNVPFLPRMIPG